MVSARRSLISAAAAAALTGLLGASLPAQAEPVVLKFAVLTAPGTIPHEHIWAPWTKRINEAAQGEFQIEMVGPAIANATNVWGRCINGVVDVATVVLGPSGQPFTKSNITNLPGLMSDDAAASVAFWRLYAKGLIAEEYKDVKLLSLAAGPNLGLTSTKPITSIDDIKGAKIRSIGKVSGDALTVLGASPIALPFSEVYQSLSRGVISGGVVSNFSIMSFKSAEVAKNHMFDVSFGMGPTALIMNKQSYDKLSAKGKAVIDSFSGEQASRNMGAAWGKLDTEMHAELMSKGDQKFTHLSPAEIERWQTMLEPVRAAWVKDTPDGARLLQTLKADYAAALAGK